MEDECPITLTKFTDAVVASDGFSYDWPAIVQWLQNNRSSPMTHEPLDLLFTSNRRLPFCLVPSATPGEGVTILLRGAQRLFLPDEIKTVKTLLAEAKKYVPSAVCLHDADLRVNHPWESVAAGAVYTVVPEGVAFLRSADRPSPEKMPLLALKTLVMTRGKFYLQKTSYQREQMRETVAYDEITNDRMITSGCEVLQYLGGGSMQIFIKTLTGKTMTLDVDSSTLIEEIKINLWKKEGIPPDMMTLVYDKRLCERKSLADYNIQKESTIVLSLNLRGGCIAAREPIQWTPTWLPLSRERKRKSSGLVSCLENVLSADQCKHLSLLPPGQISRATLRRELGEITFCRLARSFVFDQVFLRKAVAQPDKHIPMHVDTGSFETTHIFLNEGYTGGRTTYEEGTVFSQKVGSAQTHRHDVLHGVSPVTAGTRHSLFLCDHFGLMDLVSSLREQWTNGKQDAMFMQRFVKAYPACVTDDVLQDWIAAYGLFLERAEEVEPSLEVDFAWHTHLQDKARYAADCLRIAHCFVQHVVV